MRRRSVPSEDITEYRRPSPPPRSAEALDVEEVKRLQKTAPGAAVSHETLGLRELTPDPERVEVGAVWRLGEGTKQKEK